jgi:serine/threonine-protein kinase
MPNDEVPVRPGDVLDGKYRVERVLGVGGMGVVVAARHIDLNTRFALKFMLPDALRDAEGVARFQREAKAAVQLKSEHTARVTDVGRLPDGAPYMVMEFLVGKDLGTVIAKSGALQPNDAVEYVLQACEAIAEAHALGIVHRDIKPRNLFLTRRVDGRPLVKVLDFGLAKDLEQSGDHALTKTTAVMGSPQYMSPEQMRASRDVDGRTDIWSLGVCLYEFLTGTVPFDARTVPELCAMVLKDPVRPPHDRRAGIPLALSVVVMRCLEKDPRERFANVADLAEALEQFASASSRGSASRVRHVLTTTSRRVQDSEAPPPPLRSDALTMQEHNGETRTAASFDSTLPATKRPTIRTFALVTGSAAVGTLLLFLMATFLVVPRARKSHDVATLAPPADMSVSGTPAAGPSSAIPDAASAPEPGAGLIVTADPPPDPPAPIAPPTTPTPMPPATKPANVPGPRRGGATKPPATATAHAPPTPAPPNAPPQQPAAPPPPDPPKNDPGNKF